jgi:pantoate--beta-alanine ligase
MEIFETIAATRAYLSRQKKEGKTIGFVPTMGALHQGHLSLLQQANLDNDLVVCSIFVNPIQFNKPEDLQKYPRTLDQDIVQLRAIACDVLFVPSVQEMYPEPVLEKFDFGQLDKVLEGAFRPGHFNGVAVVVKKLFDIVMPDKAYFGMKDFQQLRIIQTMVATLNLPVEIVPQPTMREKDGLAMSSRNLRLSPKERLIAPAIYRILLGISEKLSNHSAREAEAWGVRQLNKYDEFRLEYLSIVGVNNLLPFHDGQEKQGAIVCVAVHLGKVRLIDNLILF